MIKITKLKEAGYEESILGFGMAMKPRSATLEDWWTKEKFEKVEKTAIVNAGRGRGHDKFLRAIQTWWLLDMPRFMSQEFATYKIGTVSLSASTMHRITYEPVTLDCFDTSALEPVDINSMHMIISSINQAVEAKNLLKAKQLLPESYMLEQVWCASYAVLDCIIKQRWNHRLSGWQEFISGVLNQVDHPQLLEKK